jgi:hypothetical protein
MYTIGKCGGFYPECVMLCYVAGALNEYNL